MSDSEVGLQFPGEVGPSLRSCSLNPSTPSGLSPTSALSASSPACGLDWLGGVEPQGQDRGQSQPGGDTGQLPPLAGGRAAAEEATRQCPADHVRMGDHQLAILAALLLPGRHGHGISIPQGHRLPRHDCRARQEACDVHQGLGWCQPGGSHCPAMCREGSSSPMVCAPCIFQSGFLLHWSPAFPFHSLWAGCGPWHLQPLSD